jgi:hypothetical protein
MEIPKSIRAAVIQRARRRCEYCHLPMDVTVDPFHVDHITARQHGGQTVLHNLALCCFRCNGRKGPNISGIDPKTKRNVLLFNPRHDLWGKHFVRNGPEIRGLTMIGRATVWVLGMNAPDRVSLRDELIDEGVLKMVDRDQT